MSGETTKSNDSSKNLEVQIVDMKDTMVNFLEFGVNDLTLDKNNQGSGASSNTSGGTNRFDASDVIITGTSQQFDMAAQLNELNNNFAKTSLKGEKAKTADSKEAQK